MGRSAWGPRISATSRSSPTAKWSNWWGSPQLVGRTAAAIAKAAGVDEPPKITVAIGGHYECFSSPDHFIGGVSPEALRRFTRIDISIPGVTWSLSRARRRLGGGPASAQLVIEKDLSQSAVAEMIRAVGRGYRAYWGACEWPQEILPQTRYEQIGGLLRYLFNVALAGALGYALATAATRIAGADPPGVALIGAIALGCAIPPVIDRAVPDVEVAFLGRTRLMVVVRRVVATGGGALGAQILAFLAGK